MLGVLVKIGSFMNSYVQYLVPSKDRAIVLWKVWCRVCWWRSEPCFVNSHIAASGHLAQLEGWLLGEFTYWHLAQNETFCRTFQLEWFLARKISNVTDRIDVSCDTQTFSPTDQKFWYDNRWTCEPTQQMESQRRANIRFKFKFKFKWSRSLFCKLI